MSAHPDADNLSFIETDGFEKSHFTRILCVAYFFDRFCVTLLFYQLDIAGIPSVVYTNILTIYLNTVVKDLGIYIQTQHLNWRAHVIKKDSAFNRLKNFLPTKTKATLMQFLFFRLIDYDYVCYFDLYTDLLNKLDHYLNNCIRFFFNLRKYDHVSAQL